MLIALHSWATYDFTQAIFDDTLPVPDLNALDVTIWLTSSLDLPDAEEMTTPHLYRSAHRPQDGLRRHLRHAGTPGPGHLLRQHNTDSA